MKSPKAKLFMFIDGINLYGTVPEGVDKLDLKYSLVFGLNTYMLNILAFCPKNKWDILLVLSQESVMML